MVGVHSLGGMVHKVELQGVWTSRPLLGLRALALRSYPAAESWRIRRGINYLGVGCDVEGAKNQEGPRTLHSPTVLTWLTGPFMQGFLGAVRIASYLVINLRPPRYDRATGGHPCLARRQAPQPQCCHIELTCLPVGANIRGSGCLSRCLDEAVRRARPSQYSRDRRVGKKVITF